MKFKFQYPQIKFDEQLSSFVYCHLPFLSRYKDRDTTETTQPANLRYFLSGHLRYKFTPPGLDHPLVIP